MNLSIFSRSVSGFASPVFADLAEEPMFDGIPLGGARREVANGDRKAERIAEALLQCFLPGAAACAVTAPAIGEDEQFARGRVALASFSQPLLRDGIDGEGWRVVTSTYEHRASVGQHVVNAVGSHEAGGFGTEIVVLYPHRHAVVLCATVLEVANQFLFLGVYTDNRLAPAGESFLLLADVEELPIAVRTLGGGDLFAVHAEFITHVLKRTANSVLAHDDSRSGEFLGDFGGRPAAPLESGDRVSSRIVPHQFFDPGDDFGRFFSTCLRPPPALRIRSASTSCSSSSRLPLATVCGSIPMNSASL